MSIFDAIRNQVVDQTVRQLHEQVVTGLNLSTSFIEGAQNVLLEAQALLNNTEILTVQAINDYVDTFNNVIFETSGLLDAMLAKATEAVEKEETNLYGNEPKDGCPSADHDMNVPNYQWNEQFSEHAPTSDFDKAPFINDSATVPAYMLTPFECRNILAVYYNVGLNKVEKATQNFSDVRLQQAVREVREGF